METVALILCFDGIVVVVAVLHERLIGVGCGLFCLEGFSDVVTVSDFREISFVAGVKGAVVEAVVGV